MAHDHIHRRCAQAAGIELAMNKDLELDFTGGPKSWFDFFHVHVDIKREGNKNWTTREKYLRELIETYNYLKTQLKQYPLDFQLWIMIDESDSGEDCVYIHTKNPNGDNFPLKIITDNKVTIKSEKLRGMIESWDLKVVRVDTSEGYVYYLFDQDFGISLT